MDLYISPNSVCCQKVQLVLAEKGIEPEFHILDLRSGDAMAPEYLRLNPNGVVPTIVDQGRPVIESSVIIQYLDESYPDPPLTPTDVFDRAAMRRWILLPDAKLHEACGVLTFATSITPQVAQRQIEAQTDPARRAFLHALVTEGMDYPPVVEKVRLWDKVIEMLADSLAKQEWLAGSAYSLAEVAILPYIERLSDLDMEWMWLDRPGREAVQPWLERCRARPNFFGMSRWYEHAGAAAMKVTMRDGGRRARVRVEAIIGS